MDVQIQIETIIEQGKQKEKIVQEYQGQWLKKGASWYLQYKETQEKIGEISTVIKVKPDQFTVIRHGNISMRQAYRAGERTTGTYAGPFGSMMMETDTRQLQFRERRRMDAEQQSYASLAELEWAYVLYLNEDRIGTYHMNVELKEAT